MSDKSEPTMTIVRSLEVRGLTYGQLSSVDVLLGLAGKGMHTSTDVNHLACVLGPSPTVDAARPTALGIIKRAYDRALAEDVEEVRFSI